MKKQAMETVKSAKQAGFTLIELMVGLATAAVIYGSVQWSGSGGAGDVAARLLGR